MPETIYRRWLEEGFGTTPKSQKAYDPNEPRDPHGRWVHVGPSDLAAFAVPGGTAVAEPPKAEGGWPVSALFKVQVRDREPVEKALAAIDKRHSLPRSCPDIPVKTMRKSTRGEAQLVYTENRNTGSIRPERIDVKADVPDEVGKEAAILHEIGHYIDLTAFRKTPGQHFASVSTDVFDGLLNECRDTHFTRQLEEAKPGSSGPTYDMIRYCLDPKEMVAKSYAQYIGDSAGMTPKVSEAESNIYITPFSEEEMTRISAAWDRIFEQQGLLK